MSAPLPGELSLGFRRRSRKVDPYSVLIGGTIFASSAVVELSRRHNLRLGECLTLLACVFTLSGMTLLTSWFSRRLICPLFSWEALNFHSCTLYFLLGLIAVAEVDPDVISQSRASVAGAVILEFLAVLAPLVGFLAALDDILEPRRNPHRPM